MSRKNITVESMTIRLAIRSNDCHNNFVCKTQEGIHSHGFRMQFGWSLMRLGGRIMFGEHWENEGVERYEDSSRA